MAIGPFCLATDHFLELPHAFLSRKATVLDEAITKEFEAFNVHIDDLSFG